MKLEAVQDNNVELVTEILGDISSLKVKDDSAAELSRILQEPHFQVRSEPPKLGKTKHTAQPVKRRFTKTYNAVSRVIVEHRGVEANSKIAFCMMIPLP